MLPGIEDEKPGLPARIARMHRDHGDAPGHECGECGEFVQTGRRWSRCINAGFLIWSEKWPACGRFQEEAN